MTEQQDIKQTIQVHRIFIKSASFEAGSLTKEIIDLRPVPKIDMQVHVSHEIKDDKTIEAVLTLQLIAKQEEKILWRMQLQQAGLFTLDGFGDAQRKQVISGFCMNMMYPYACQAISELVVRGGFEPVYLAPMNFDALYQEQLKKEKEQGEEIKH
jgi:preprotein translocase subunit SecB